MNLQASTHPTTLYEMECWRNGVLVWVDAFYNLVTTVGKNKLLDYGFVTGIASPLWYVGLVNSSGFTQYLAADTMSSHAGWLESSAYSDGTRPAFTGSAPASGSTTNSANRALFNINATVTIQGAFLVTNNTVGGTTGTLYGAGNLTASRSVLSGDQLKVQVTLSLI